MDARQWVESIQEYRDITELDASTLNRLIKEIVVHETIDSDKTRHISIEIHFNLKPIPEVPHNSILPPSCEPRSHTGVHHAPEDIHVSVYILSFHNDSRW